MLNYREKARPWTLKTAHSDVRCTTQDNFNAELTLVY